MGKEGVRRDEAVCPSPPPILIFYPINIVNTYPTPLVPLHSIRSSHPTSSPHLLTPPHPPQEEEHKTTLREEVEREYYPEKYSFHPFGDPWIYKRKYFAQKRSSEGKAKEDEGW